MSLAIHRPKTDIELLAINRLVSVTQIVSYTNSQGETETEPVLIDQHAQVIGGLEAVSKIDWNIPLRLTTMPGKRVFITLQPGVWEIPVPFYAEWGPRTWINHRLTSIDPLQFNITKLPAGKYHITTFQDYEGYYQIKSV